MGTAGLYDLTRARQRTALISPEMERTILTIRKRLESTYHPQTRYALIGASAIQAELKALNIRSVPCPEPSSAHCKETRDFAQVRGTFLACARIPDTAGARLNQLHQVDLVGPIYLKGQKPRHYIFVCKDVFDGAVCLKLGRSRKIEAVLAFLGECWKTLGRPKQVQFDNAREYLGWGPAARYLSRMIRLCLRFEVEPIFIPPARPQYNGSVENFNGWFQPRLFQRHFTRISALKRELQRLQDTVNTQHVQRRLAGLTPEQYRRRKKLQKLPPRFVVSTDALPIAAGRVTFIRQVTIHGKIHLLSQTFSIGKRLKGQYVKVVLDTQRAQLTVYVKGIYQVKKLLK
jgi:transposase InsO family protein